MCAECGQIFDTKKQVDNHLSTIHNPHRKQSEWENSSEYLILGFSGFNVGLFDA
jgi:hypothetical protein